MPTSGRDGRPALVIAREGEEAHGSGRSIPALHLLDALESCRDLFTRFGGHAHAVGFALPSGRLAELKVRLNAFAQGHLSAEDLVPEVRIDAELQLSQVTPPLLEQLRRLEPFGQENPEPVFASRGVNLLMPPKVVKERHLKFLVKQKSDGNKDSFNYEAIGWRMAERLEGESYQPGELLDLAFTVGVNHHPDFGGIQLTLEDFQRAANSVCSRVAGVV